MVSQYLAHSLAQARPPLLLLHPSSNLQALLWIFRPSVSRIALTRTTNRMWLSTILGDRRGAGGVRKSGRICQGRSLQIP
jgi:hypothetical protein